jgi:signal transduction histidine kinase
MGYVAVSESDVTYQAEIDEARRVKSELLANMSHELRTPLNSIIGFAELMAKGKVGPMAPEHLEFVGDIAISARRLLGLVNDVLDLARFDAGTITLAPVEVDVAQVATELREVLKVALAAKELGFAVEISEGCDRIHADPTRFAQAISAFVERAVKVTPARGQIVLRCGPSSSPHELRLAVEAGGPQLTESQRGKMFVEFEQHGGLGLALARRIVEAHGGRVEVETDDHGSTLIAILPR